MFCYCCDPCSLSVTIILFFYCTLCVRIFSYTFLIYIFIHSWYILSFSYIISSIEFIPGNKFYSILVCSSPLYTHSLSLSFFPFSLCSCQYHGSYANNIRLPRIRRWLCFISRCNCVIFITIATAQWFYARLRLSKLITKIAPLISILTGW